MRRWRGHALALTAIASVLAGALALASLLWPQSQSSYALDIAAPTERFAPVAFEVDGVHGWLVMQREGELTALWSRSPHRGCRVELLRPSEPRFEARTSLIGDEPGVFLDPCGASLWRLDGTHLFGPAPRGLDRFPLATGEAALLIDLGRVLRGACPDGATTRGCSDLGLPVVADGPRR